MVTYWGDSMRRGQYCQGNECWMLHSEGSGRWEPALRADGSRVGWGEASEVPSAPLGSGSTLRVMSP